MPGISAISLWEIPLRSAPNRPARVSDLRPAFRMISMVSSTRGCAPAIWVLVGRVWGPITRRFPSSFLCAALPAGRSNSSKFFSSAVRRRRSALRAARVPGDKGPSHTDIAPAAGLHRWPGVLGKHTGSLRGMRCARRCVPHGVGCRPDRVWRGESSGCAADGRSPGKHYAHQSALGPCNMSSPFAVCYAQRIRVLGRTDHRERSVLRRSR